MVFGEIVIFWLPPCVKFSNFKRYHLFTFNILSEESVFTETPNEALYTIKMILIQIRWTGGELVLDPHWPPTASTRPLTPPRRRPPTPRTPPPTPRTSPPTPPRGISTPTTGKVSAPMRASGRTAMATTEPHRCSLTLPLTFAYPRYPRYPRYILDIPDADAKKSISGPSFGEGGGHHQAADWELAKTGWCNLFKNCQVQTRWRRRWCCSCSDRMEIYMQVRMFRTSGNSIEIERSRYRDRSAPGSSARWPLIFYLWS